MKNQSSHPTASVNDCFDDAAGLLLDNLPEALLLADESLTLLACNRKAKSIFGQKNKVPEAGMNFLQFLPTGLRAVVKTFAKDVLSGRSQKLEYFLPTAPEQIYETHFSPALNKAGSLTGILIRSVKITQQKKDEKAIQEAEERWQFAFEASGQAAWDWNMQTGEVIYSSSYKKLYGFSGDDLKNDVSEWQRRIHPDDKRRIEEAVAEHSQSENPYHETTYRIQLKNGEYKWIMARGKLLSKDADGRPLRMIGTHTDLTQTLQNKEELNRMNERFHYAAKASSQALWEWNAVTGEAYVSPGFTEMFGWQADENQRFEQWHQYVHPDDRQATVDGYYQTLTLPDESIWQAAYRFLKADGTYAHVCDKAYIFRSEDGQVTKVIGATQNVTERKRLEEELLRNELEMKKRINQATVDSQEQERSEIGRELHDNINQVLTTTKLYLELALANKDDAEELLTKSAENVGKVVTEIRQLSRSLMDPTIGDLGVVECINDLVENLNLTRRIHIDLYVDETIEASLNRKQKLTVFRIIQEALNNVIRHAGAACAAVSISQQGNDIFLEIKDDGAGFVLGATKKGAGLKNIINRTYLINGSFSVESSPDNGCIVKINFPIKDLTNA